VGGGSGRVLAPDSRNAEAYDHHTPHPYSTQLTDVYDSNETLMFSAPGWVVGWLYDGRALVNSYTLSMAGGMP
jgi:hypothetical protein